MHILNNKYAHLVLAFFIFSLAGVMSKNAAISGIGSSRFFIFVGAQVLILGMFAIIWQQVLKRISLITATSFRGIVVILSLVWAAVIFRETISAFNIIGSVVIAAGIYIVASDEASPNELSKIE